MTERSRRESRSRQKPASPLAWTLLLCLLFGLTLVPPATAQGPEESPVRIERTRPRVGLVLSGGGARGAAHIGVLQILEELHVPVDFVIGTSMGSIVGGLYASGYSAEELADVVTGIDWTSTLSNQKPRSALPFRRREDDRALRFRARLKLKNGVPQIPSGAIDGRHILSLFRSLTLPVAGIDHFDELPLPFRAVASDIRTGEKIILDSGDLALAMRASMSVPGVFTPVELGGHLLVDGGITDNLPIGEARTLEPDILIAVDVGDTLLPLDESSSILEVVNQMLTVLIARESQREVASLGRDDLLIVPDLEGLSSADFTRGKEGIEAGRLAALAVAERLRTLSTSAAQYASYQERRKLRIDTDPIVEEIRLPRGSRVDTELLTRSISTTAGEPLDFEQLALDVESIDALELFDTVDVAIESRSDGVPPERVAVEITARPSSGKNEVLRFHLGLRDDYEGETDFTFGLRYSASQFNDRSSQIRVDALFGERQLFAGEWYQPMVGGLFTAPQIGFQAERVPLFDSQGSAISLYRLEGFFASVDFGVPIGRPAELRIGYRHWSGEAQRQVGSSGATRLNFQDRRARLLLRLDTQDTPNFPRRGTYLEARVTRQFEGLFETEAADHVELRWTQALSSKSNRFAFSLEAGSLLDEDALYFPFDLGGFQRLSSLSPDQLVGRQKLLLSTRAYREIAGGSFGMPIFVGLSAEAGNLWNERDKASLEDLLLHGSLFLGIDSYLGPAYFGLSFGEHQRRSFFFSMGRRF